MAKSVKKKDAEKASNLFHNIMAASVTEWHPILDDYTKGKAPLPKVGDKIIFKCKDSEISETATFLSFDGVHFAVKTENSIQPLVVKSPNFWKLVK